MANHSNGGTGLLIPMLSVLSLFLIVTGMLLVSPAIQQDDSDTHSLNLLWFSEGFAIRLNRDKQHEDMNTFLIKPVLRVHRRMDRPYKF